MGQKQKCPCFYGFCYTEVKPSGLGFAQTSVVHYRAPAADKATE